MNNLCFVIPKQNTFFIYKYYGICNWETFLLWQICLFGDPTSLGRNGLVQWVVANQLGM
jgi:hypothetical protein